VEVTEVLLEDALLRGLASSALLWDVAPGAASIESS
jgi:hypothetical protein